MEQTILVMEVIQEVCEADNGEPDCGLDNYLRNFLNKFIFPWRKFPPHRRRVWGSRTIQSRQRELRERQNGPRTVQVWTAKLG